MQHGVDELVQLVQALRLGRLDHQRAVHRERQRRRVVAVVHETFGDVSFCHTCVLELTAVEDKLVSDMSVGAGIDDAVRVAQFGREVVGLEDRRRRGFTQPFFAHHVDVAVADECHVRVAVQRRRYAVGVFRRERTHELGTYAHRAHARTAARMRRSKRFVQVQVAHIRADSRRIGVTDLGVHVRAVHIHEAAVLVYDLAHMFHVHLEDAVRGGVGDHAARQTVLVLLGFLLPVREVGVAAFIAADDHGLKACLHAGCGIGAVRRSGNQQHFALGMAVLQMVVANDHKARIFACRAGCGLQRRGRKTRDDRQLLLEVLEQLHVALHLVFRRERMDSAEAREGNRHHRGGGVEFHRARTQRNHAMC